MYAQSKAGIQASQYMRRVKNLVYVCLSLVLTLPFSILFLCKKI